MFRFIRSSRFGVDDFISLRDARGSLRLAESFLRVLLSECAPLARNISDAATRMIELILAAPREAEAQNSNGRPGEIDNISAAIDGGSLKGGNAALLLIGPRCKRR